MNLGVFFANTAKIGQAKEKTKEKKRQVKKE